LISGFIVVIMGICGVGKLIHYMPDTVKYGFTAGIAVTIGAQQLKDFIGVSLPKTDTHFLDIILGIYNVADTISVKALCVSIPTLAIIIFFPRFNQKIPAPLIAITLVTSLIYLLELFVDPHLGIATIGTRFTYVLANGETGNGIPPVPPEFKTPWTIQSTLIEPTWLIPAAIRITLLGSIESLLSAVIADGMADPPPPTGHNPDSELVAIGIANIVCACFGGIPATGAIARTATNIKFGAKSPISAMIHSVFALICVIFFSPAMSHVPMAALSSLLLFVANNMGEPSHFAKLLKTSPTDDKIVLLFFSNYHF
jgi:SulP family sulfate permease